MSDIPSKVPEGYTDSVIYLCLVFILYFFWCSLMCKEQRVAGIRSRLQEKDEIWDPILNCLCAHGFNTEEL